MNRTSPSLAADEFPEGLDDGIGELVGRLQSTPIDLARPQRRPARTNATPGRHASVIAMAMSQRP